MATFGVPQPVDEDQEELDKISEENIAASQQEEEDGLKTGRSQWTSLTKAREERA